MLLILVLWKFLYCFVCEFDLVFGLWGCLLYLLWKFVWEDFGWKLLKGFGCCEIMFMDFVDLGDFCVFLVLNVLVLIYCLLDFWGCLVFWWVWGLDGMVGLVFLWIFEGLVGGVLLLFMF